MNKFDNLIFDFIKEKALFENCSGIVLAVSGGPDSMAMLDFFINNKNILPPFIVAHVNHKLRKESEDEIVFVKNYCKDDDVICETVCIEIEKYCPKGTSTETFSRCARYAFFNGIRRKYGYSHICTAHNADDNLETLILNLLRGAGLNGAGGIPALREDLVARPFLRVEKTDILNYCKDNNIPFVIDKTNLQNIYTRNVVRNNIIPHLKEINQGACETIGRFMESAERDEDYLQIQAEGFINNLDYNYKDGIQITLLKNLHPSLLSRIIRKIFCTFSTEKALTFKQTDDIIFLIRNGKTSDQIQLYSGWFAQIAYDRLFFTKAVSHAAEITEFKPIIGINPIKDVGYVKFTKINYNKINKEDKNNIIDLSTFSKCVLRSKKSGDIIRLPNKVGSRSLKKLYIDNKIPRVLRSLIPVLATVDGKIVWVYGFGTDIEFLPKNGNYIKIEAQLNI